MLVMMSSVIPITGLKKTQAIAIVSNETVRPTTTAKMIAAMATIEESSQPTSGIQFKRLIIGEKRK